MGLHRRFVLAGFGSVLASPGLGWAKDALPSPLVTAATALMADNDVPALGVGLVRAGKVVGVQAFGLADRETRRAATVDTAFHVASVSKVVTGTVLMRLWEQGRFKLNDPIAPHLDFPVVNPRHADKPITFRQVFNHTSGISDRNYHDFTAPGDPKTGLRDFLVGYLTPGGRWYTTEGSYGLAAPGERFSYSNVGTSLAGYLAERIAGKPLQALTAETIFKPLGMRPAAWTLADLGKADLATPYLEKDGKLGPIAAIGYPDWPAGLLRASPRAMTQFLAAYAGWGALGRTRILEAGTVATMIELQVPPPLPRGPVRAQGLFWEGLPAASPNLVGKFGGDDGAHALIAYDPPTGHGLVVLANRSPTRALETGMIKLADLAVA